MSENEIKRMFLDELNQEFHIEQEVKGQHFSGKQMRVDAVLRPRHTAEWKRSDVAFGLEFKDVNRFSRSYDTKNFTKWLAQCVDYSNTKWDRYGYLYIFCCPSLVDEIPESVLPNPMFLRNFMGQLGIGELKRHKVNSVDYGLSILLHGSHRIWSSKRGVEDGRRYALLKKFGSR